MKPWQVAAFVVGTGLIVFSIASPYIWPVDPSELCPDGCAAVTVDPIEPLLLIVGIMLVLAPALSKYFDEYGPRRDQ